LLDLLAATARSTPAGVGGDPVKRKRTPRVQVRVEGLRGWHAVTVRAARSTTTQGIALLPEEVGALYEALGFVIGDLDAGRVAIRPVPLHIARAWGPLRVLVAPEGVRLWRRPSAWPIEGVAITLEEAPHVRVALERAWP
jgi:hypothetical protein